MPPLPKPPTSNNSKFSIQNQTSTRVSAREQSSLQSKIHHPRVSASRECGAKSPFPPPPYNLNTFNFPGVGVLFPRLIVSVKFPPYAASNCPWLPILNVLLPMVKVFSPAKLAWPATTAPPKVVFTNPLWTYILILPVFRITVMKEFCTRIVDRIHRHHGGVT